MSMEQPVEQPRDNAEEIMVVHVPAVPAATGVATPNATMLAADSESTVAERAANVVTNVAATDESLEIAPSDSIDQADAAPQRQAPPPPDPRRRLRELLAIPDRDRSDALWDELIELEIQLAPGNRASPAGNEPRQKPPGRFVQQGRRPDAGGAPKQNRPHAQAHRGQNAQHHGQPGGEQGQGAAAGLPGTARPAKRFFKKVRRPPRPAG
jgi:hypothetical protein